jgi:hypothetical protein
MLLGFCTFWLCVHISDSWSTWLPSLPIGNEHMFWFLPHVWDLEQWFCLLFLGLSFPELTSCRFFPLWLFCLAMPLLWFRDLDVAVGSLREVL